MNVNPQFSENYTNAALCCPHCGGDNLHHDRARVFTRSHEDGPGAETIVDGAGVRTVDRQATEIPSRRESVALDFWCETCPRRSRLLIHQHKGATLMEWQQCEQHDSENEGVA